MNVTPVIQDSDKRAALEQVLTSATFVRATQVRNFLRYICEMELRGLGHTLHEYLIGVEALGRPNAYSTDEDSSVRRRATGGLPGAVTSVVTTTRLDDRSLSATFARRR